MSSNANGVPSPHVPGFSCLPCRQRKVKCDRRSPCSNCEKADKECSFVAPVRGKRKRTKPPRESLHAKLRRYERLLESYGETGILSAQSSVTSDVELDSDASSLRQPPGTAFPPEDSENVGRPRGHQEPEARLVVDKGNSRYYDSPLWSNLGDALPHSEAETPAEQIDNGTDIEESQLYFGPETSNTPKHPAAPHPSPHTLSKLKDIYIDRVDALVKILHIPSFWKLLLDEHEHPNRTATSPSAMLYAFYLATINAMDDSECSNIFGLQKSVAFSQYKSATQRALVSAGFPATSSPVALQAYALYMICVRNCYPSDTLYIMSGIAIRLALKMGLHRDGTTLGLSPFETEMRRRLWWHLVHVDARITDVLGTRPSSDLACGDAKNPLNCNDEDLDPNMTQLPEARPGITPITLCVIRCEINDSLKSISSSPTASMRWEGLMGDPDIPTSKKHDIIDEIEDRLERKYMRYCDPSNSFHTYISIIIRSSLCKMRLFSHKPPSFTGHIPDSDRDIVFANASKLMGYVALLRGGSPGLDKYMWQIGTSYLWNIMLYVLIEIRRRKTGPEVDKCWELIRQLFTNYPQVGEKPAGAAQAFGRCTLKVWDEYVTATKEQGWLAPTTPEYINKLQRDHAQGSAHSEGTVGDATTLLGGQGPSNWPNAENTTETDSLPAYDFPSLLLFESHSNDWLQWDQLLGEQVNFS